MSPRSGARRALAGATALVVSVCGCAREVVVGADVVPSPVPDAAPSPREDAAVVVPDAAPAFPATTWPWAADHERGDFGDWTSRTIDVTGGVYASPGTERFVNASQTHGGRFGVELRLYPDGINTRYVRLFRKGNLPATARYRIWVYVPRLYQIDVYWNLMQFAGRNEAGQDVMLWDMSMRTRNGALQLYVFDHVRRKDRVPPFPRDVPIGRWFEVAVELRRTPGAPTRLRLLQDGVSLIGLDDLSEPPGGDGYLEWNLGAAAVDVTPSPATLHLDDAAIEPL